MVSPIATVFQENVFMYSILYNVHIWASFGNNDQETKIFPCRLYNTYFVLYLGKAVSSVEAPSAEEWGELCLEAEPHRVTIVTQRGATSLKHVGFYY